MVHELKNVTPSGFRGTMTIATLRDATPAEAAVIFEAPVEIDDEHGGNGRSPWKLVRLQDGSLMLACFPHGGTYEMLMESTSDLWCDQR